MPLLWNFCSDAVFLNFLCRYGAVKDIVDDSFVHSNIPGDCNPIHLNLVVIIS